MDAFSAYIPTDRRNALAQKVSLEDRSEGAALFADVSGFTPLTEALARSLGPRRGAEELTLHLNSVYQALIHEVERYGGSVIAFAGDAITCWFQADKGRRAVTCAQAMQQAMQQFSRIQLADGTTVALAVKVGIACGPTRRFVVGDPKIQVLDVLAGSTLSEMAAAAHLAGRGDIIASGGVAQQLGPDALVMESRKGDTEEEFFVLQGCRNGAAAEPWPELPDLGKQ